MFDPNVYTQLAAIDPAAAAQYLATTAATAATPPPSPAPAATAQAQGFAQAQAAASAPQQVAARGTLEDFFNQPSGGGGPSVTSKFFNKRPQGSWLQFTVLSDVTHADVLHQKTPQGQLQYFKKNGQDDLTRPKLVLVVKVNVTGSSDGTHTTEFPDGSASLWLKKGPVTDNLIRAMAAAGDPSGYPKGGAQMVMQSAGEQASRTVGYSATKLYDFKYAAPASGVDPTPPALAVNGTAISAAPMTPPPAPALTVTTATEVSPVPATDATASPSNTPPAPEADDPKAAERAALLAKLQGANS